MRELRWLRELFGIGQSRQPLLACHRNLTSSPRPSSMHRRLLASRLLYSYARTAPARCRSRALSIAAATGSSSWRSISGPSRRPLGLPRQDPRRELHATMSESTALRKIAHELAEDVTTQVEGGLEDTSKVPGYRFPAGKLGKLQSAEKTPLVVSLCTASFQRLRH